MIRLFNDKMPWSEDPPNTDVFPEFPLGRDSLEALEFTRPPKRHSAKMYRWDARDDTFINTKTGGPVVFLNSSIEVRSAEHKDKLGRAGTYQAVHASEAARWLDLRASLGALLSCCHPKPETIVIMECTANGMNAFHSFWTNLKIGAITAPTIWTKIFIPFFWDAKYEIKPEVRDESYLDDYEESLFKRIQQDPTLKKIDPLITNTRIWDKLFWRRRQIADALLGDLELFKQEFPATEAEAFMFSGQSIYDQVSIQRIESTISDPTWLGNISLTKSEDQAKDLPPRTPRLEQHPHGRLKIWEHPKPHERYCLFADVAEGKAIEGISEDKSKWDFSCAQILKVTQFPPLEQVAVWHGNCDPDMFGPLLVALGIHYNNAFIGWEANSIGRTLGNQIAERLKYRNIYMRQDMDVLTNNTPTLRPGWHTNLRTKPYMVVKSQQYVRLGEILIHDASTLSEMKSYARLTERKYGASTGHDDRVMALAGAIVIIEDRIEHLKRKTTTEKQEAAVRERKESEHDPFGSPQPQTSWDPVLGGEF